MNPYTARFDRHDCALAELISVPHERRNGGRALLFRAQRDEPDDPAVRLPANNRNLAEVFVERDHHLMITVRVREDLGITGIARPIRNALDLVSGGDQYVAGAAPDAAVEQHLHGSAIG
jgi:hypothetical protein